MPANRILNDRTRRVLSILGMALVWPSIHNQLLYPVTFSFHKEGADGPFAYYLIYSLIMLAITALLAFGNRERIAKRVFTQRWLVAGFGAMGALGTTMLVLCDFGHEASRWLMGAGVVFAAVYVPIYFMFWSTQITYASEKRAGFDLVLSYILFCALTAGRLALKLHSWPFAIGYQVVSSLCAFLVLTNASPKRYALSKTSIAELPLYLIVPCVIFVYVATMTRCLLNPLEATFDYPPTQRTFIYLTMAVAGCMFAFLYRPHSKLRRYANLPAFAMAVGLLALGMLATGLDVFESVGLGNMPAIAGINTMELFIWILVLANSQVKHTGILRSAALYLVFVIGACHLITVLFAMSVSAFNLDLQQLPLLAITIILAFVVVIAVNSTMTALLYHAQKQGKVALDRMEPLHETTLAPSEGAADVQAVATVQLHAKVPESARDAVLPCMALAEEEDTLQHLKEVFALSKREVDTLRLAAKNMSAKEMAESLFVAESTVNSHLKGIYRKCDVHSRKELIALVNRFRG